ncbi:hypothetical protein FA10DRAFT_266367 [Acaromyces ingoldii]|uniref:Uncharacterized protein n=1 Tax=Acaromyces ingoldii TaxID=215250 RepID=A0A316YK65_9BASI|nr:hypothetical protein FA10DRAFT_266367 [Acaromyces ingoldii]PWN89817.1 hypothetical protein FA10DRAFT_266367 [Acaromyces ingoldii]
MRHVVVVLWLPVVLLVAIGVASASAEAAAAAQDQLTAQEAYERALVLLRSTLSNPSGGTRAAAGGTRGAGSHAGAGSGAKSEASKGAAPSERVLASYRDVLSSWSPFSTMQRLYQYLTDYLRLVLGSSSSSEGTSAKKGSRRRASKKKLWETSGAARWDHEASYGDAKDSVEVEQARRWAMARPEQVWPEWDGGDDAFFGPFETSEWDVAKRAMRSDVHRSTTGSSSSKPKKDRAALATAADRRRDEAVGLLTWASGWGDSAASEEEISALPSIDWRHEASRSPSRDEYQSYIDDFLVSSAINDSSSPPPPPPPPPSRPHTDALWVLATHSLWGTHGARPDPARAKACFQRLASLNGNASAHRMLGWLEGGAWGSEGWQLVGAEMPLELLGDEDRQARALTHYTAAAEAGDAIAQSALAFRYHAGVGVPESCGLALLWFQESARDAHKRYTSGPPGGLTLPYTHLRLSDMAGGAYGPGSSAASTGHARLTPAIHASLHSIPSDGSGEHRRLEDFLEFFTYHAERGSTGFALRLARIYYGGSVLGSSESAGRVPRDYEKAREYALRITRQLWPTDSAVVRRGGPAGGVEAQPGQKGHDLKLTKVDETVATHAGVAAGLVGRMWLRGEGVRQDYARAWVWFSRGAEQSDAESFNSLGIMYRDGLGVAKDVKKAVEFFELAAGQGSISSAEACVNLGKFYYEMGEWHNASRYFELAVKLHNQFEAHYYLASINARMARLSGIADSGPASSSSSSSTSMFERIGPPGTASYERCRSAVTMFKYAVERADWGDATFARAERAWHRGFRGMALMGWAMAGERGFEAAQNNVAWVLDRDKQRLRLPAFFGLSAAQGEAGAAGEQQGKEQGGPPRLDGANSTDRLALIHWTRSAAQDNVDAMVKMGDYYYYGLGISPPSSSSSSFSSSSSSSSSKPSVLVPAYDKAAACYAAAADRQTSALAYWNMGWMYESGLGVPRQDFHLAKRYYDMAWETNPSEAYLPVMLSLIKLHLRALWATLLHGDQSALSLFSSYALLGSSSLSGAAGGLGAGIIGGVGVGGAGAGGGVGGAGGAGGGAYTEQQEVEQRAARAAAAAEAAEGNAAGTAAGARGRKRGSSGELADPNLPETYAAGDGDGDDDDAEGAYGSEDDDDDDDTIEGALIVFGLAALAGLVYWRQGVQLRLDRMRRENAALLDQANRGGGAGIQAAHQQQQQQQQQQRDEEDERRRREQQQPFGWPPGEEANHLAGL